MIKHCPVSDLNPYAREVAIEAMNGRIARAEEAIKRSLARQRRRDGKKPFGSESFVKMEDGKPVTKGKKIIFDRVPRWFHVWDDEHPSFYEIIDDTKARIKELEKEI